MIFEERIYTVAPGKMEALLDRFRTTAMRLFERHGIHVVGFWITDVGEHSHSEVVYLCSYPDWNARETAWERFRQDPEWIAARRVTEAEGPLVLNVAVKILQATDFSPIR